MPGRARVTPEARAVHRRSRRPENGTGGGAPAPVSGGGKRRRPERIQRRCRYHLETAKKERSFSFVSRRRSESVRTNVQSST